MIEQIRNFRTSKREVTVKLKVSLILFLFIWSYCHADDSESTYYVSPGIRVSWNFKSSILMDLKISYGRMRSEEYYYNITIGKKLVLRSDLNKDEIQHIYLDLQGGSFGGYYPVSAGGGIGAAIFTGSRKKIYPRITIFGGAGLFCTLDYVFARNLVDFGLQAVLPISFNKDYRTFDQ